MLKDLKSEPKSVERLSQGLMDAIYYNCPRRVKAYLALGANPNLPFPSAQESPSDPNRRILSFTLPLAYALETPFDCDNCVVAELLLTAGADVGLCLYWLSKTELPDLSRIVNGLILCEVIHKSPQWSGYKNTVENWLEEISVKLNQRPEPTGDGERKYQVLVHAQLMKVSKSYGKQHIAAPWVTAIML